jgi:hypothetical protein
MGTADPATSPEPTRLGTLGERTDIDDGMPRHDHMISMQAQRADQSLVMGISVRLVGMRGVRESHRQQRDNDKQGQQSSDRLRQLL